MNRKLGSLGAAVLALLCSPLALAETATIGVADAQATSFNGYPATMPFSISRGGDMAASVAVAVQTQDGSAVAGTGYTAVNSVVTIPAGSASAMVQVPVAGHPPQPDKEFFLQVLGAKATGPLPSFSADQSIATSTDAASMAAGDLNLDGRLDVVIGNEVGASISVMRNATAPGASSVAFSSRQKFTTAAAAGGLTVADLNGDGRPDIAVTHPGAGSISVLLNATPPGAGAFAFTAHQGFTVGAQPRSVSVADVNLDGRPDLVVANKGSDNVSVLLNMTPAGAAAATFAAASNFGPGQDPIGVTLGDVNGDGRPDMAVTTNFGQNVSVLLNDTAPGAATPAFGAAHLFFVREPPVASTLADVDGDGRLDLVVAQLGKRVIVRLNTTAAGSTTPSFGAVQAPAYEFQFAVNLSAVAAADANGDGRTDLWFGLSGLQPIGLMVNTTFSGAPKPSFQPPQAFGSVSLEFLTLADLNNDGMLDVLTATQDAMIVRLATTPAPADTFGLGAPQSFAIASRPRSTAVADFNNDGRLDVAATSLDTAEIGVRLNTSTQGIEPTTFAATQSFGTGASPRAVTTADIDADGRADLVVANGGGASVSVLLNQTAPGASSASFAAHQWFAVGASPNAVATADVNGDGRPDLLAANYAPNTVSVLINTTAPGAAAPSFSPQATFAAGVHPRSIAASDVNRDGRLDLVAANEGANTVSVLLNSAAPGAVTPAFAAQTAFAVGNAPVAVTAADVNGDGRPDLAVANFGSNSVSVLLNATAAAAAAPSFSAQQGFATGTGPIAITAADLDGDGRRDLATANFGAASASVLLNRTAVGAGAAAFAAQAAFATDVRPRAVAGGDLDRDGTPDLVTANETGGTVSVLPNTRLRAVVADGTGTGTIHYVSGLEPFSFAPLSNAPSAANVASNPITVCCLAAPVPISVSGHASAKYSINGSPFTSAAGMVDDGDSVRLLLTSPVSTGASVSATLSIDGTTASWTVTTGADSTPKPFSFANQTNVAAGSVVTSNAATISGINQTVPVSLSGDPSGRVSVSGSGYATSGSVVNGGTVRLRLTAAATPSTTTSVTVDIGGVLATWSVTTAP